jgi:hypothetical protein
VVAILSEAAAIPIVGAVALPVNAGATRFALSSIDSAARFHP